MQFQKEVTSPAIFSPNPYVGTSLECFLEMGRVCPVNILLMKNLYMAHSAQGIRYLKLIGREKLFFLERNPEAVLDHLRIGRIMQNLQLLTR